MNAFESELRTSRGAQLMGRVPQSGIRYAARLSNPHSPALHVKLLQRNGCSPVESRVPGNQFQLTGRPARPRLWSLQNPSALIPASFAQWDGRNTLCLRFKPPPVVVSTAAGSHRAVAQLGRAPRSGRGGRGFESLRPDHSVNQRFTDGSPGSRVSPHREHSPIW